MSVIARLETLDIPTYGLGSPEKNPLFFEKRVYQGSRGKVYPVPFIDKVYQDDPPRPVSYQAARLENDFVKLVMLPEIGGRIYLGQDKKNNDYDFFYRQDVIKPALVGLAGPWISGGVEFNWPQHHRPGTYLPTDVIIEDEGGGVFTVWMSEHDPLNRLKGMHGIRLRPDSSLIELRGRLYNRTPHVHTFLWWANVAARVHENYQSFFPTDVRYVADHAVRAMSSFPIAENSYYGVDYAARPGANDLTRYSNIPVPTSYMVCQTQDHFFGGYDYDAGGGFIHVANRHIAPGKKQWTWGNDEFGWAWDRELTDRNGPYIELMAGVFTDNQPDFAYLHPYETKTFSQFWWPYQELGPVQQAGKDLALRLEVGDGRRIDLGVAASRRFEALRLVLLDGGDPLHEETFPVAPDRVWKCGAALSLKGENPSTLHARIIDPSTGRVLLEHRPPDIRELTRDREVATEPPLPEEIDSSDELYLTGEHLEQYRHPTRYPELYWSEALKRDPNDARCHLALGKGKLSRGQFDEAERHFRKSIARLTFRHPNPETGEAHYHLGLCRRYQDRNEEAYAAFYKSTWNYAWRAAAFFELACIDLKKGDPETALAHLEQSLETNATSNKTLVAKALALADLSRKEEALELLESLHKTDPLDHLANVAAHSIRHDKPQLPASSRNDAQTALDLAFDLSDLGRPAEAAALLRAHLADGVTPVTVPNPLGRSPMVLYALAWLESRVGETEAASETLSKARAACPDFIFPSRLHERMVLEWALTQPGADRNAAYGLGNFLYDKKLHEDAISAWENARAADPHFATAHRNLGIAYWNSSSNGEAARASYEQALKCDPGDSRLVAEFVQLLGKLGDPPESRLAFLEAHRELVLERDDATVELAELYNQIGQPGKALELLMSRSFHPWEGGEGKVLRQFTEAHLRLGCTALDEGDAESAFGHFESALETPDSLGEKYHPLQAKADVTYWQAKALQALGRDDDARAKFNAAAAESGDFQSMAVTEFSELTGYKALALHELGHNAEASRVLEAMLAHAMKEKDAPAKIDYFATSLPNLLVFDEDSGIAKRAAMDRLIGLARQALDQIACCR
jgi:tetratricopeptide (TPR) repeat protein